MLQDPKFLIIITTVILIVMVLMLVIIYSLFIQKKTELLIAQQEKQLEYEKELAQSLNEVKEQTMKNIGLELHDNIGQKLSLVRLRSNQLSSKLENKDHDEVVEISSLLGECIQDIRNLSKNLNIGDIQQFDLMYSLNLEIEKLRKIDLIRFHLNDEIQKEKLHINPNHSLIIFRMIQETLNNVYRHSRAKNLTFQINEFPTYFQFIVKDDGKGFNTNLTYNGKGIKNLRERAKIINAEYSLYSEINVGTQTKIKYFKNEPNSSIHSRRS